VQELFAILAFIILPCVHTLPSTGLQKVGDVRPDALMSYFKPKTCNYCLSDIWNEVRAVIIVSG
jgi:hypothetical protein